MQPHAVQPGAVVERLAEVRESAAPSAVDEDLDLRVDSAHDGILTR
jgi:hypothetical protein